MSRFSCVLMLLCALAGSSPGFAEPLPGTEPLTLEGDIAAQLVEGVDRFLLRKLEESVAEREKRWNRDVSSRPAYLKSIQPQREILSKLLGVQRPRVKYSAGDFELWERSDFEGGTRDYQASKIGWPVLEHPDPRIALASVTAEGLLLVPRKRPIVGYVVAIPDADQLPEQCAGFTVGINESDQYARLLAENGCVVLVPALVNRKLEKRNGRANVTDREFLYRPLFETGHHLIGVEVQKVLAGMDWMERRYRGETGTKLPFGVIGYGEGGMIAALAGALDERISATCVCGYFGSRQNVWQEPIDRNIFGYLKTFGDAEIATLIAPRELIIHAGSAPELTLPSEGGAPARLVIPQREEVDREVARAQKLLGSDLATSITLMPAKESEGTICRPETVAFFLKKLGVVGDIVTETRRPHPLKNQEVTPQRQARQFQELERYSQELLAESPYVRAEFMKRLDTSTPEKFAATVEPYREHFRHETIGEFGDPLLPPKPRTRLKYDTPAYTGYEVTLDVWPDVFAYGILLVPKNVKAGERRPVVVCQHGLEGRPTDVLEKDHPAYHDFAAKLAERGFVTFAPQNLYIGHDKFRTLQRKANPLGCTLFSIIVPQHQQLVNWLGSLPFVDRERIAFYGLSYGGKSAMRIPPLVKEYCLSICSADFNDWVDKNASTRGPYSYVWTNEYEIFEWDLGSTFNYAEMAALICPRPFMVERGHFDGVGVDERVAAEFAKVRHLYNARLKLPPDRCQIEWFVGPHTINGQGTFDFLHHHLNWPAAK